MDNNTEKDFLKVIQFLNKISYIPVLIVAIYNLFFLLELIVNFSNWFNIILTNLLAGSIGLIIVNYDQGKISPKIKQQQFNSVIVDSFCLGVLGCIYYGAGTIILIKAIVVGLYLIWDFSPNSKVNSKNKANLNKGNVSFQVYDSLREFSGIGGILIILMAFYFLGIPTLIKWKDMLLNFDVSFIVDPFFILLMMGFTAIVIDYNTKDLIRLKEEFNTKDVSNQFFLGILGCVYFCAGIFIVMKACVIFFLTDSYEGELKIKNAKQKEEFNVYSKSRFNKI